MAIALLNWSDDEGYFLANTKLIHRHLFPFEEDQSIIPMALNELKRIGFIRIGSDTEGRQIGQVINFSRNQSINKKLPSKLKDIASFPEHSRSTTTPLPEHSSSTTVGRKEGRKEGKKEGEPPKPPKGGEAHSSPPCPTIEEVRIAFEFAGGTNEMADAFWGKHDAMGWHLNGQPIRRWQSLIGSFIRRWQATEHKDGKTKPNSQPERDPRY
jgi:hypothetical protein